MAAKKKDAGSKNEKGQDKDKGKKKQKSSDRIANLEKTLGKLSETVEAQNEYIKATSPVINTLAYNPELRDHFKRVTGQGDTNKGVDEGKTKQTQQGKNEDDKDTASQGQSAELDRTVADVATSQRDQIIAAFEKERGIDQLNDEEKKSAREKVTNYLGEFGWSVKTMPVSNLRNALDKAYTGTVQIEKWREEGKVEGATEALANRKGTMGQVSGGAPSTEGGEEDLSDKQKEYAEKLGVDVEEAKETYLTRADEYKRPTKAEKKEEGK